MFGEAAFSGFGLHKEKRQMELKRISLNYELAELSGAEAIGELRRTARSNPRKQRPRR